MDLKGQILPATMTVFLRKQLLKSQSLIVLLTAAMTKTMIAATAMLSIISLFVLPVLLGAAGIIVGYIARRRGAQGLGAWAMGIGVVSLVLGIFIIPFF